MLGEEQAYIYEAPYYALFSILSTPVTPSLCHSFP